MRTARHVASLTIVLGVAVAAWNSGCSGNSGSSGFTDSSGSGKSIGGANSPKPPPATGSGGGGGASGGAPSGGLVFGSSDGGNKTTVVRKCTAQGQCVTTNCASSGHTTISGTVYDPAGVNPLYNVAVYVPQSPPSALPAGASCYTCESLYTGGVVAGTLTDPAGHFSIMDAPTGTGIPLVVQIGKWRRQYTIDVADCTDTQQPLLRLPANASEGDMPNIAISTGASDSLECLLRRIGVDAGSGDAGGTGEYVSGAGGAGHIHIFQGGTNGRGRGGGGGGPTMAGGSPASSTALWTSGMAMQPYDIVILSCEGAEAANSNAQALNDYAGLGGRVFASHFHYSWFNQAPFAAYNLAAWKTGTQDIGNINALIQTTLSDGVTPFPKGIAMEQWLTNVNALSATMPPELPIQVSRHNADVTVANVPSTPWIIADTAAPAPGATQYFSWDMPIPNPTNQPCGRVVYSDLHVGAASGDYGQQAGAQNFQAGAITPSGCANNALSPQEKALEFMLFDLSSCLTPVGEKPTPPTAAK